MDLSEKGKQLVTKYNQTHHFLRFLYLDKPDCYFCCFFFQEKDKLSIPKFIYKTSSTLNWLFLDREKNSISIQYVTQTPFKGSVILHQYVICTLHVIEYESFHYQNISTVQLSAGVHVYKYSANLRTSKVHLHQYPGTSIHWNV